MISLDSTNPANPGTGGAATLVGRTLLVSSLGTAAGVRENWTNHFNSIPAAVTAAQSGDVIVIAPGTYSVSTNIAKNGVSYRSFGSVTIEYSGSSFLFNCAGFTDGLTVDGMFTFRIQAPGLGCFNLTTAFAFSARWDVIRLESGQAFNIESSSWPTLMLTGDIYSSSSVEAVNVACGATEINFFGNLLQSTNSVGVSVVGTGLLFTWTGNMRTWFASNTEVLLYVGGAETVTINGNIEADFVGKAIRLAAAGASVVVNGFIRGAVTDVTNNVNENNLNSFVCTGEFYGAYFGSGQCRAVFSGNVPGLFQITSADSHVTVNGNFTRGGWQAFDISAGVLVVNGDLDRTDPLPSSITGGLVSLNGNWVSSQAQYLNIKGQIYLGAGTLRLSAAMQNTGTGPGSSCVHYEGGILILQGSSMFVSGDSPPIISTLGSSPIDVRVYGDVENIDSVAPRAQEYTYTIVNALGALYEISLDATPYAYVPAPGDTVNLIAAGLAALITDPAFNVAVLANVITVQAVVPGTLFVDGIVAGAITRAVVSHNHVGLNNVVTGTVIITDPDVL